MREGDACATRAFAAYRADLATGLANLVTFYNPSLIVLGGGLSRTAEIYDGLEAAVDQSTLPATRGRCAVVQSALGFDCAAMGAAWLVFAETARTAATKEAAEGSAIGDAAAAAPSTTAAAAPSGGAIVSVGLVCMDSTMWVAQQPAADSKSVASRSLTRGGGNAANSSVAGEATL